MGEVSWTPQSMRAAQIYMAAPAFLATGSTFYTILQANRDRHPECPRGFGRCLINFDGYNESDSTLGSYVR
jgi:hypothetical protein